MMMKKTTPLFFLILYFFTAHSQVPVQYLKFDSLLLAGNTDAATLIAATTQSMANESGVEIGMSKLMFGRLAYLNKKWVETDSLFVMADEALVRIGETETECYTMILMERAIFYHVRKRYDEGAKIYQQNLPIQNRVLGPTHISTLRTKLNLGMVNLDAGKLTEAERYYLEAIRAYEAAGRTELPGYARAQIGYGTVLSYVGKTQLAKKSLEKAVAFSLAQHGKASYYYTKALFEYSCLLMMTGEIEEAEPRLLEVVAYSKPLYEQKKANEYCSAMVNLGEVYNQLAQYEKAKEILTEAVAEIEKTYGFGSMRYQFATYNLGIVYTQLGNYDDAEIFMSRSSASALQSFGPHSDRYLKAQATLVLMALKTDRLETAKKLLDSLSINVSSHSNYSMGQAVVTSIQAQSSWYAHTGEHQKALACLDTVLHWNLENGHQFTLYHYRQLIDRKNILLAAGLLPEAAETLRHASALHKTMYERQAAVLTDTERQNLADDFLAELSTLGHLFRTAPSTEMAGEMADLLIFSQNLSETTTRRTQIFLKNTSDTTIVNLYDQWLIAREQLGKAYDTSPKEANTPIAVLKKLEAEVEGLEKMLVRAGVPMALREKAPNWMDIRDGLLPGDAAVSVSRMSSFDGKNLVEKPIYAACVIRQDLDQPEFIFWENGNDLESFVIGQYQNEITRKKDLSPILFEKMWAPVAAHLQGVKTVYFSPDGIFHKINLNSLRAADGTYLLDNIEIKQVTNLRNILDRGNETSGAEPGIAALFGNPAFKTGTISNAPGTPTDLTAKTPLYRDITEDAKGDLHLTPLPGSEREVNAIAKKLTSKNWQTTVFTGAQATEDTLKKLKSPKVLHVATHGYFLNSEKTSSSNGITSPHAGKNPALRSMLFFAGAENSIAGENTGRNDGILTAFEAAVLNLDQTELVVLSACNTGLGKIQNGEGVFGLQRAFRIAGAKSLIMSLWEVEDAATELLMNTFYENWLSGMSKSEAFRKAQLTLKAKYPQPFYWGSFILVNG